MNTFTRLGLAALIGAFSLTTMAAPQAVASAQQTKDRSFVARGIYMTATSMQIDRFYTLVDGLKKAGGNTVIFDAKDEDGIVSYKSNVPLAKEIGASDHGPLRDLKKRVDYLHANGIHVAGRICLFHDPILAKKRPDLALKTKAGKPFPEKGKPAWSDPNLPVVQQYNLDLANELAAAGVDEIQFDYIRYPAQGKTREIAYGFDPATKPKHTVITGFLQKAYNELHRKGKLVSIDVYGVIAWQQNIDERITGQRVQDLAKYTDFICPMVYPSHFGAGFDKYRKPADEPYYFVSSGVSRLSKLTAGTGVSIRPWLQAFPWRVSNFGPGYVTTQIKAAHDEKAVGWMMWNAGNKYEAAYSGMKRYNGK